MERTPFPVFDADHHLYEPPEAILTHLPAEFSGAVEFVTVRGRTRIAVLDRIIDYMPNPTFERVAAPGAHEIYYAGKNVEGRSLRELSGRGMAAIPAFREPGARLQSLDEQGVRTAIIYPTLANLVEYSAQESPDLVHAIVHALNQWLHETWSFAVRDRIFTTPVISLALVDEAVRELEWVLERGARCVLVRPAPVLGLRGFRSPALPEFDPFWSRVEAAGIPVVLHASLPPLMDYVQTWEPARSINAFEQSPFKVVVLGHREISDMLASLICHGTLTRFPRLRIASVENGSNWLKPLLEELELTHGMMPQAFAEHPVEVLRRNVWLSPFWEADVTGLVDLIGADRLMFGSDWPHPEGLARPLDYLDTYLAGVDDELTRGLMSSNGYAFMGLPVPA